MIKNLTLVISALVVTLTSFAQDLSESEIANFYESDASKIIQPDLSEGIPSVSHELEFSNFIFDSKLDSIEGLASNGAYITTDARQSTVTIKKENIGRVVLYAKLYDAQDTLLYNPRSLRSGRITIDAQRDGKSVVKITRDFDKDLFSRQIHMNTYKHGIDEIDIKFNTEENQFKFVISKLEIIPYNSKGIKHYKELEKREQEIFDWSNDSITEREVSKIKDIYQEKIVKIESSHRNLTGIITGQLFQAMATVKANSLNPFKNETFLDHYRQILENASAAEKDEINNLIEKLGESDFTKPALILDNLFLGGKFASIISLIDGLFKRNINLQDNQLEIIYHDEVYYEKNKWGNEKLKLVPIDEEVKIKIEELKEQNEAYKKYVDDIANFLKEDAEGLKKLEEYISTAKSIRNDLEDLIWDIFQEFADREDKSSYFESNGGVKFSTIVNELDRNFQASKYTSKNLAKFNQLKSESSAYVNRFETLIRKCDEILSDIKTQYDSLYEIKPKERKKIFNDLDSLDGDLKSDWKDKQDEIINEYTKDGGLQEFLSKSTGKEKE